ncbi:Putative glycerol kinase 5, partial [Frankliniella fusca]
MGGATPTPAFIAALDVGTTSIRCHIIDASGDVVATATDSVKLLYPKRGYVEIDPEVLWESSKKVVEDAIRAAGLRPEQVTALGVSTQRSTFVTWDRVTGKPFHNFITWKDVRADSIVRQWNSSLTWRAMRLGARCLHAVTGSKRFLAGSVLRLMNTQVTCRFNWALNHVPALREAVAQRRAAFGTVDTWLMYKMTAGRCHVTDVSAASATGFFDPFTMSWATWALGLFGIPEHALPAVGDSAGPLGESDAGVWGAPIPIRSLIADQSAAVFGACCFKPELIKVTMGTGTFVNINTAGKPHASVKGLYPVVGWRVGGDLVYLVEGASSDTANIVNWGQSVGLYADPAQSSAMAEAVGDSDGVLFIPAFSGLQAPVNDFQAAAGFLGIKPTARKEHMVRAMLESLAFRVAQLLRAVDEETSCTYTRI